ncbi:MAG: hypothetical protein ABI854_02940, partial [Betaproteobacteria bacterium]
RDGGFQQYPFHARSPLLLGAVAAARCRLRNAAAHDTDTAAALGRALGAAAVCSAGAGAISAYTAATAA